MDTVAASDTNVEAAAADAAAEERHDRVARTSAPVKSGGKPRVIPKAVRLSNGDPWHRFDVEVWLTNFNSVEFGFYKRSRNRAKSRQFSIDMDVFAEVRENGERTGLLGYREDLWRKNTGMDKRLVFKLFSETLSWQATMDLMLGRSLQMTLGARGIPVPCFALNTGDHEQMIYLERSAAKWPGLPENFAFFLLEEGVPRFYRFRSNLVNILGDYSLLDEHDKTVGTIRGRLLSIGGHWEGRLLKSEADKRLLAVMKLFAGMIYFNAGARRHIAATAEAIRRGQIHPKIERQETDLYMNPRRVR